MKLYVKRWKRKFTKNGNYKDSWVHVGVKDVRLSGMGDNTIAYLNGRLLTGVFSVSVTSRYIEFIGFDYKNQVVSDQGVKCPDYVHVRCHQLGCDRPHDD